MSVNYIYRIRVYPAFRAYLNEEKDEFYSTLEKALSRYKEIIDGIKADEHGILVSDVSCEPNEYGAKNLFRFGKYGFERSLDGFKNVYYCISLCRVELL